MQVRLSLSLLGYLVQFSPAVTVSMMEGAMRARVELDTEPTREMNRSSLGMTAARVKVNSTRISLTRYSTLTCLSADILSWM